MYNPKNVITFSLSHLDELLTRRYPPGRELVKMSESLLEQHDEAAELEYGDAGADVGDQVADVLQIGLGKGPHAQLIDGSPAGHANQQDTPDPEPRAPYQRTVSRATASVVYRANCCCRRRIAKLKGLVKVLNGVPDVDELTARAYTEQHVQHRDEVVQDQLCACG